MKQIYNSWTIDSNNSNGSFNGVVKYLNLPGQIISLEPQTGQYTSKSEAWLDQYAGVDWLYKLPSNQLVGVAVRIQSVNVGNTPYNSFTVRSERHTGTTTELAKRSEAIKDGYLYPYYTVQCYVCSNDPTKVLSAAIIKTSDLYAYMVSPDTKHEVKTNHSDNNFKVVYWSKLDFCDYNFTSSDSPYCNFNK